MIAGALSIPRTASSQTSSGGQTSAAARLAPAVPAPLATAGPGEPRIERTPESFLELPQVRNRRGVPFMIAGGAMFLAGAIIGGDGGTILVLGGIGVGAYGAYVYFR
jgi:hypothetical protein